jgi:predicted RNA methylase
MPTISDQDVRDLLAQHGEVDGLSVRITRQLDRAEYEAVNKVLTNLGGKWNRKASAHLFPVAPGDQIDAFVAGGAKPGHVRRTEGYVATPAALAVDIVRHHADLNGWSGPLRVLEPSAGDGSLVAAILEVAPRAEVWAVEPNILRADVLAQAVEDRHHPDIALYRVSVDESDVNLTDDMPGTVTLIDGSMEAVAERFPSTHFNAVVMNPPFAMPGQPTIWIDHLRLAFDMVIPGGRVVCIAPAGFVHRTDAKHEAIRELVDEHGGWRRLPADSFKASGTGVECVVLWLDKVAPEEVLPGTP